jgi:hypothetical protein
MDTHTVMKHHLIALVPVLALTGAAAAHAQIIGTTVPTAPTAPITATYAFTVPVAKVVPNPCSTTFELVSGQLQFTIRTTDSGASGFAIAAEVTSSGIGQDALATGALVVDGTQKPEYSYTYASGFDASFQKRPADFGGTLSVVDLPSRSGVYGNDWFMLRTQYEVNFTNGVPSVPLIKELTVSCPQ